MCMCVCVCGLGADSSRQGIYCCIFCEQSMIFIDSWKICDQLIDYQLSKTRSAVWNSLLGVFSITFTYISV
jgi:hypothetical protein